MNVPSAVLDAVVETIECLHVGEMLSAMLVIELAICVVTVTVQGTTKYMAPGGLQG
ncbi:hypothetical protein ACMYSQ_006774 [Aspergillus niger]